MPGRSPGDQPGRRVLSVLSAELDFPAAQLHPLLLGGPAASWAEPSRFGVDPGEAKLFHGGVPVAAALAFHQVEGPAPDGTFAVLFFPGDPARRADVRAGQAADAVGGGLVEGRCHFPFPTPARKRERARPVRLAGPDAASATSRFIPWKSAFFAPADPLQTGICSHAKTAQHRLLYRIMRTIASYFRVSLLNYWSAGIASRSFNTRERRGSGREANRGLTPRTPGKEANRGLTPPDPRPGA